MNKKRRERIEAVVHELTAIMEEEQAAYDNLPESIQSGERGDTMQEKCDGLQDAIDALESVCES